MKKKNIDHYGINAKEAFRSLSLSDNKQRNHALKETAKLLKANVDQILEANKIDIENSYFQYQFYLLLRFDLHLLLKVLLFLLKHDFFVCYHLMINF